MVRPANDVTEAELEIMRVLWELDCGTIREVVDRLYDEPSRNNYQTVKKLMSRLETKKLVGRKKTATAHTFRALVGRSDLIQRRLSQVAESLCDGSSLPLLTCLLQGKGLPTKERKQLQQLFEELTSGSKPGRRKNDSVFDRIPAAKFNLVVGNRQLGYLLSDPT